MPGNIILPQWGMGMNEGQVVRWLKSVGDDVAQGDPLVEIESTKVNAEVEATTNGTLVRVNVEEGKTVPVGTILGLLLLDGETEDDLPAIQPAAEEASGGRRPRRGRTDSRRRDGRRVVVTPRARRLARELGVEVENIAQGSGPGGRITEDDVRAAAESGADGLAIAVRERIPLEGMRGTIAQRMAQSATAALVTLHTRVDVTEAVAVQRALVREWRRSRVRPQYQDIVIAATVKALSDNPLANAHISESEVTVFETINLGFALAVPGGLIVPVIADAGSKSPLELAQSVRDLVRRSKSGGLGFDELTGSTFSLTNLSSYGVEHFNPLINPPEIAILGVGRVVEQPSFNGEGEVEARSMGHFSLTFDHRAIDGAPAGELLDAIASNLSSPDWMLE